MEKRKIVILGAGIAGLSLGLYLKKNNENDFIILNPTSKAIHKACTGLLTNKTISLLKELDISLTGYNKVREFVCEYNDKNIKDYSSSGISLYYHEDTGRIALDNRLYDKCLSLGISIKDNCKNILINDKEKIVTFNNESISYDFLVDARGFYNDINITPKKDIGFEAKIKHEYRECLPGGRIILNNSIKGYGWIIYSKEYDVIGLVDEYKKGINYNNLFSNFINSHYLKNHDDIEIRSAFIPIKPHKVIINKYHINIGDKAGLVDPLTQEGIYYALYSAKMASIAIKKGKLNIYKDLIIDVIRNFKFANFIRNTFFKKSYQDRMWNISISHKFTDYVFMRYSSDECMFNYKLISKYHKEYKRNKI